MLAQVLRYDQIEFEDVAREATMFRGQLVGCDEERMGNWVEYLRIDVGGVFLDVDALDCRPYPSADVLYPLPRDRWASALADAVEEEAVDGDLSTMIIDGWLLVFALQQDQGAVTSDECASMASTLAPLVVAALKPELELPDSASATTQAIAPIWVSTESVVVSVDHPDLDASAEAVRIHWRSALDGEQPSQLYISGPCQDESIRSSANLAGIAETPPLVGDDVVIVERLRHRLGDVASALDHVTLNGETLLIVGAPDQQVLREADVFAARRIIFAESAELFRSQGLAYIAQLDLGASTCLDADAAASRMISRPVASWTYLIDPEDPDTELTMAWATRSEPGHPFSLEIENSELKVLESSSDDLARALLGELEPRMSQLSPSRWIATGDLLVAVGTHKGRPRGPKRWFLPRSVGPATGPTPHDLYDVFEATAAALGWNP